MSSMTLTNIACVSIAALLLVNLCATRAQAETVTVGPPPARMNLLKSGSHRYLRYKVKDGKRIAGDIWDRTVSFEIKDARRLLHITQRWDEVNVAPGKPSLIEQDSWFEAASFKPITQTRRVTAETGVKITGYKFLADMAVGATDLPGNQDAVFSLSYSEPPFNFEYDMEMFQVLPLRAGYEANIPFLDVGIDKKADRYTFKVAGSDRIAGWDGRPVDCWVLTSDYNTGTVRTHWWLDKKSQIVIREESKLDDGSTFIKTLLPPEAAD
jgi:hypothetical protein